MKIRLFTRSGITLMLGDVEGVTLPELARMFMRGEVCVQDANEPGPATEVRIAPDPKPTVAQVAEEAKQAAAVGRATVAKKPKPEEPSA